MVTALPCAPVLLVLLFAAGNLSAQSVRNPPADETFTATFDAAYMMRPRVGMYGITELMMAALDANLDAVRRLVAQGADLEETDDTGGTPLMWAVQGGDIEVVEFLLDSGADVGAVGGRNATALMIAVTAGQEEIGARLLEAGATFGGELSYQQDYLEYAAARGQATMVRALIDHGANLEASGADALCLASRHGHIDAARALIEAGVDVNRRGNLGNDLPLIHALQAKDSALVRLLVESGADSNLKDRSGRTSVLYYATQTGQSSIISYLLENGASLARQEAEHLLASAVRNGSVEMVDILVSSGARIVTKNLFNAVASRQYAIADRFADAIGLESLDDYVLDLLVDQAANSGHEAMLGELLDIVDAREARGPLRLLFETVDGDDCALRTWDPRETAATSTVLDGVSCESRLFTSRRDSSLFVLHRERIDIHSLDAAFATFSLPVPTQQIEARLDEIRAQFGQQFSGNHDWVTAEVVTVGYLDKGEVTLITHTSGPADGTYASQFAWDGGGWALVGTHSCHRFDWVCHTPGVDGRSIDRWPMRRAVWHAALERNPGFVDRVVGRAGDADGLAEYAVNFSFDGQRSELGYALDSSDHCATECLFTTSVTLRPDGADAIAIPLANSRVSIADRFILLRPGRAYARIHDLVTGEDMLGNIGRATWIH